MATKTAAKRESKINLPRFLLGLAGVSVPAAVLQESGHTREAWLYVWLMLAILVLTYQYDLVNNSALFYEKTTQAEKA